MCSATAEQTTSLMALWAEHSVTPAATGNCTVSPPVQNLSAHATSRVLVPQGHAEPALEGNPEQRGGDMGVNAARFAVSKHPHQGPGKPRGADDGAWAGMGHQGHQTPTAPRSSETGTSGRGIAVRINVCAGRDGPAQGILRRRQAASLVKVEGVESWPQHAARVPARGEAGDVGGRSMFCCTSSAQPARSDAERG